MERAKFVAYEQNAIVSLMKNLLWNVCHGNIDVLFSKNVITNQMSFLFIEFNFCPEKQESQIVKITPSLLSRVVTRIEISRSRSFFNVC